jgi:hypothetical protein
MHNSNISKHSDEDGINLTRPYLWVTSYRVTEGHKRETVSSRDLSRLFNLKGSALNTETYKQH